MAAGCPLDDTTRAPWLAAIAAWLAERAAGGECAVVSCSALTRAYRDVLRGAGSDVRMVHLAGPYELVAQRLAARRGHFMPPPLLASQYAVLEPLAPDEPGITLNLEGTPAPRRRGAENIARFHRIERAQRGLFRVGNPAEPAECGRG